MSQARLWPGRTDLSGHEASGERKAAALNLDNGGDNYTD